MSGIRVHVPICKGSSSGCTVLDLFVYVIRVDVREHDRVCSETVSPKIVIGASNAAH